VIFLNKNVIIFFIKTVNIESANNYLNMIGFNFSKDQIRLILPVLKNNIDKIYEEDINGILQNLPKNVTNYSKNQLIKLFNLYIKKEEDYLPSSSK
jgi:hypothetical protein